MKYVLDAVNSFVWGVPALFLIISVGVIITLSTGFAQFRLFPKAMKLFFKPLKRRNDEKSASAFRALCTALAATVGTGNLAGVAGAIAIGGPGAIFWMWICGILGMATKFAEATLAVRYRKQSPAGEYYGGPMYMVRLGMGRKWQFLAALYSFFGLVAAFGVGSATQVNAVLGGINSAISAMGGQESKTLNILVGLLIVAFTLPVLLGGARKIGEFSAIIVPFAAVFYILLCLGVLAIKWTALPGAFSAIIKGALSPSAVTGGVIGSAFRALRVGASRGVFTNEAGMGTAGIAHASAQVSHPVEQGLMGIVEVFLDTIVICTLTALVILSSGTAIPYGEDLGIRITSDAFAYVCGDWVHIPIAVALAAFAIATIIGWGLYGVRCAQFLFGETVWRKIVFLQALSIILGVVLRTDTVWSISETANGLMAIPNLLILLYLCPEVVRLTKEYKKTQRLSCKRR